MRIGLWDNYGLYLVMADRSNSKVAPNYGTFCGFRRVLRAIEKIAITHNDQWYEFEGNRFKKLVNSADAKKVLFDFKNADYNKNLAVVANQLGVSIK